MKTHNPNAKFGAFVKSRRIELGMTARAVAEAAGMQPSNFSNLEHGLLNPPKDPERLRRLSSALQLEIGHPAFAEFADLAAKASNSVPLDIAELISENDALPLMLRSIGRRKLTKDDVKRIVALVRGIPH